MTDLAFRHRLATRDDLPVLEAVMEAAIAELQRAFLGTAQIAASRTFMGLDTQLVDDGTYFVVEQGEILVGCGGWSRRATLYGGDRSPGRDAALLDPAREAARVRAMYTHPDLRAPRCRPPDPQALRGRGAGRGVHPRRAHGDDGRRAALSRVRLSGSRAPHGRPGRSGRAAGADVEGPRASTPD